MAERAETPSTADTTDDASPRYEFRELAREKKEVVLTHQGKQYRLIATKNGRLVLNR